MAKGMGFPLPDSMEVPARANYQMPISSSAYHKSNLSNLQQFTYRTTYADVHPDPRFKYVPLGTDHPIFHGIDGVEAEEWVCAVRHKALSLGRQRDNDWVADFASTCLAGDALRWYENLDEDVQGDWRKLRLAILTQWPAPSRRE